MIYIISLAVIFVGGGWLIGKGLSNSLFPEQEYTPSTRIEEVPTVIHNHTVNNHLHITEEQLEKLKSL